MIRVLRTIKSSSTRGLPQVYPCFKEGLEHIHTDLNELDIQDINEYKPTAEDEVEKDEASQVELSDDLNRAIKAKNEENPQSW